MIKSVPLFEFSKIYINSPKTVAKGYSLIYILISSGDEIKIRIGKSQLSLNKDDIYILSFDKSFEIKNKRKVRVFLVECKCSSLKDIKNKIINITGIKKQLLNNILDEYDAYLSLDGKKDKKGFGQMIKLLFEQFFILLLRERSMVIKDAYTVYDNDKIMIENIIAFLKENTHKKLKLSDVVKYSNISSTGLKTLFKKHKGMGIMKYFSLLKIEEAKLLLHSGKFNISQIAELLGYESVHYFSKNFKSIEGISPSSYLKTDLECIVK